MTRTSIPLLASEDCEGVSKALVLRMDKYSYSYSYKKLKKERKKTSLPRL
jgi:hypothetical protein